MVEDLEQLMDLMLHHGAKRVYAKELAPNDNSKNQVYLGGDFSALNIIPHGEVFLDSRKLAGSKRDRPKASVKFYWIDNNGKHLAPDANLILYPDYPEVRMSGLLKGCGSAPSSLMNARLEGRVMFFGVTDDNEVLGMVVANGHPLGNQIKAGKWHRLGVFLEIPQRLGIDARAQLLSELRRIHNLGWIPGKKFGRDGVIPYSAPNAGGYTLEAELGVSANGTADPDYLGWEVKQYGVTNFERCTPKSPVTLMTPEPTGGVYREEGPESFIRRFGYPDTRGRENRTNFGGIYRAGGDYNARTDCSIVAEGFNAVSGKIEDIDGGIYLRDSMGVDAAFWTIKDMMRHWNRKHAKAAYVPSMASPPPRSYSFGPSVLLCERTDFTLFLQSFAQGTVYYDPGIKLDESGAKTILKRRSQFRVKHSDLRRLYHESEVVALV